MRRTQARSPRARKASFGLIAAQLLAAPVLVGIAYTVAATLGVAGAGAHGLDVGRLVRVATERATWAGLAWTMWVSAAATILAACGAVLAVIAFRGHGWLEKIGMTLSTFPLMVPHLVAAMLGLWLLSQSGMLARVAITAGWIDQPTAMPALVYDRFGIGLILTYAWKEFAFLAVVASALLATRGDAAEEAARTLGASPWVAFRRVTWPVLWRGLAPAIVSVFIFVAGNYEAAALLAPSDPLALPLLIAERAADPDLARRGDAYVASALLLVIAGVAVLVHELMRAKWEPLS